jgi:predicted CopG family antitoxin
MKVSVQEYGSRAVCVKYLGSQSVLAYSSSRDVLSRKNISGLLTPHITRFIIRVIFEEVLVMQKKLTVTIDEEVYEGLRTVIGPRKISRFIEDLVRPHVVKKDMFAAYKEMAADQIRESEALEWAEGTIGDLGDEKR